MSEPLPTHIATLPGAMLNRGFWLYVLAVDAPAGLYLYVGRTGDNSFPYATAPYGRLGQHLTDNPHQNMLRQNLEKRRIQPESCESFRMVACGPLFPEVPGKDMDAHKPFRDKVAALEKALADALKASGYDVLNTVNSLKPLDRELFSRVVETFSKHFPELKTVLNR